MPTTQWKTDSGLRCPHGLKVMIVNGSYVRNRMESDFDQGGNGYAYDFVPKNELWIDNHVPRAERPFVTFHECEEVEFMKTGMSYDDAHEIVKGLEDKARKIHHPGERRIKRKRRN